MLRHFLDCFSICLDLTNPFVTAVRAEADPSEQLEVSGVVRCLAGLQGAGLSRWSRMFRRSGSRMEPIVDMMQSLKAE